MVRVCLLEKDLSEVVKFFGEIIRTDPVARENWGLFFQYLLTVLKHGEDPEHRGYRLVLLENRAEEDMFIYLLPKGAKVTWM